MPAAYPYTTIQRFDMVSLYTQTNRIEQTQELFHERYPESPVPRRNLIMRMVQNLRDFGQFTVPVHAQARGRLARHPDSLYRRLRNYFIENPQASTRQIRVIIKEILYIINTLTFRHVVFSHETLL